MTVLEQIQEISGLIYDIKAQLSKDEKELERITLSYLTSKDPKLLEELETLKNTVIEEYKKISTYYESQSIKYLEISAQESDTFDKIGIVKMAGDRMRLAEEAIAKAHKVFDSHNF